MPGTLFVVGTPIGNLGDITTRALRVLGEVAVIAAEDTRRTARLLARYAISTPTTSLHAHNEYGKTSRLVDRLARGDSVALVSDAGTPTLSDPGAELVRAAAAAGARVEAIPGPSAVTTLLSVAGLSGPTFTFMGFPPRKGRERARWFEEVRSAGRTVIFFEAPHRIRATLAELLRTSGDRQVVVGREMTKVREELLRGRLSQVISADFPDRGELTVAVDIGLTTESIGAQSSVDGPSEAMAPDEMGQMMEISLRVDRRIASEIAAVLRLKTNDVYEAFMKAGRSVK
jgi:16S rRNA (cytidine1402-2'-O)-methyltransferase